MFYILFNFFLLKRLGGFKKVPHKVWEYEIFSFRTRKHCACSTWAGCLGKRCSRYSPTKCSIIHDTDVMTIDHGQSRAEQSMGTSIRDSCLKIGGLKLHPCTVHWYSKKKNLLWYSRSSMVLLRDGFRIFANHLACWWGFCLPISGGDAILNAGV